MKTYVGTIVLLITTTGCDGGESSAAMNAGFVIYFVGVVVVVGLVSLFRRIGPDPSENDEFSDPSDGKEW